VSYRDFKNVNIDNVLSDANITPWENIYALNNIDSKVSLFNSYLLGLFDKHAPVRTVKLKKYSAPWITSELKRLINTRNKLWKMFKKSGSSVDFVYRQFRNQVKQKLWNSKVNYYNGLFSTSADPKFLWSKIKSLGIGTVAKNPIPVVPANDLVNHYTQVSKVKYPYQIVNTIKAYNGKPKKEDEFYFKYVLPRDIAEAVSMTKSKAKGVDMVPATFIQHCLPVILPVIEHIFNFSLQNSVFPSLWKPICCQLLKSISPRNVRTTDQ